MSMFRKEALAARREQAQVFGEVIFTSPVHHQIYAVTGLAIGIALVVLLVAGQYTRRITVAGQLVPQNGLVRLVAQSSGVISTVYAADGDVVGRGQPLFQLDHPKYDQRGSDTRADILDATRSRYQALQEEMRATDELKAIEVSKLRKRLGSLQQQQQSLAQQVLLAKDRLGIAQATVDKFANLSHQGFISSEQLMEKKNAVLTQSLALAELERLRLGVEEQIDGTREELAAVPAKYASDRSALFRSGQQARLDVLEQSLSNASTITAPVPGRMTTLMVKPGYVVMPGQLLGTLVPDGSRMEAALYVPSHGIGFVTKGSKVNLRYRAFPFQKFGQASGTVTDVSAVSMRSDDADQTIRAGDLMMSAANEPVYRVRVALDKQTISVQGKEIPLMAGAALDADIMLDRKPLYRWILDPIGRFSDKLFL